MRESQPDAYLRSRTWSKQPQRLGGQNPRPLLDRHSMKSREPTKKRQRTLRWTAVWTSPRANLLQVSRTFRLCTPLPGRTRRPARGQGARSVVIDRPSALPIGYGAVPKRRRHRFAVFRRVSAPVVLLRSCAYLPVGAFSSRPTTGPDQHGLLPLFKAPSAATIARSSSYVVTPRVAALLGSRRRWRARSDRGFCRSREQPKGRSHVLRRLDRCGGTSSWRPGRETIDLRG